MTAVLWLFILFVTITKLLLPLTFQIMKLVFFVLSVFFNVSILAQFTLKGILVNAGSDRAIAGASVFLSNTSVGTISNTNGEFELLVPAGRYDVVVSFVGYETVLRTITGKTDERLKIEMTTKAKVLDDVVVGTFEKNGWERYGKLFTDFFIGTSELADDCTIKNYKVLRFRNNKKLNKLTVSSPEPMIIENKALGYKLQYQLETFEYSFRDKFLLYLGYPLFTAMDGSRRRQAQWNKKREEAYYGSITHFMRAIYINKVKEEGFEVRRLVKTPNLEKKRVKAIFRSAKFIEDSVNYYNRIMEQPDENSIFSNYTITGDSIAYAIDSLTAGLEFENYLHIYYPKKIASLRYHNYSPGNDKVMSEVHMVEAEPIQIQSNGSYFSPLNLITNGYWAWQEKISAMLPFDYTPPVVPRNDNLKKNKK
jgi:hypothetical protein